MFGQPGSSNFKEEYLPKLTVEQREKDNQYRIKVGIEIALRAFIKRHTVTHEAFDFVCAIVKELCENIMNDGWAPNGYWYPRRFSSSESFHSRSEVFKDPF